MVYTTLQRKAYVWIKIRIIHLQSNVLYLMTYEEYCILNCNETVNSKRCCHQLETLHQFV